MPSVGFCELLNLTENVQMYNPFKVLIIDKVGRIQIAD